MQLEPTLSELEQSFREFCKQRDRLGWLERRLGQLGIVYELQSFSRHGREWCNIILPGTSALHFCAHWDIVNPESDNANDNSASVFNLLELKRLRPGAGIILTDGEESGGVGAGYWANSLTNPPSAVLNLELSGLGGEHFILGEPGATGPLGKWLLRRFGPKLVRVPFNDSVVLRKFNIDSVVINPLPKLENGEPDLAPLQLCHSLLDSCDRVSMQQMQEFVHRVLVPCVDEFSV